MASTASAAAGPSSSSSAPRTTSIGRSTSSARPASRCARSSARPRPPTSTPASNARRRSCARRLLASELHGQDDELAEAGRSASRPARALGDRRGGRRGRAPPGRDRGAARRSRERAHRGMGPADRGACAHERIGVRAEALAAGRPSSAAVERRRAALGALADELRRRPGAQAGDDPVSAGMQRMAESLQPAWRPSTALAAQATTPRGAPGWPRCTRRPNARPGWRGGSRRCSAAAAGLALGAPRSRGGAGRALGELCEVAATRATPPASARRARGPDARRARARTR